MDTLRNMVLTNPYIYALTIFLIVIITAQALFKIIEGIMKTWHHSQRFDHKMLSVIHTPFYLLVFLISIQLIFGKIIAINHVFSKSIMSLIIITTTYVLIRVGNLVLIQWSRQMSHNKGEEFHLEILPLMRSVTTIILTMIALLLFLQVWEVQVGALLTSLGIAGVILGLAFKDSMENVFGGINLILDDSLKRKDLIQLEDGELGEVLEITLRSTKLKNLDSETIIIPNSRLANSKFINMAQPTPTVRIKIPINVAYGNDPEQVKKVLLSALKGHPRILKMPKRFVRLAELGEYSINFEVYFYIKSYWEYFDIKDDVLSSIYKTLYKAKIEIPFPVRSIISDKPTRYKQKWKTEK